MATWRDLLLDVLTLTGEVKRLDETTLKLAERTLDIDRRVLRLETMVEMAARPVLPDRS